MYKRHKIGESIHIVGYGNKVFEIVRIRELNIYYYGTPITDFYYECREVVTGSIVIAHPTDVFPTGSPKRKRKEIENKKIDELLDKYNDYMSIHKLMTSLFGSEEEYLNKANEVIKLLKRITEEN